MRHLAIVCGEPPKTDDSVSEISLAVTRFHGRSGQTAYNLYGKRCGSRGGDRVGGTALPGYDERGVVRDDGNGRVGRRDVSRLREGFALKGSGETGDQGQ